MVTYLLLLCLNMPLFGQTYSRIDIPIFKENKPLKYPFTGGLKAGQLSNIDLDGDGKNDLFVFDRNGDQILPFVKTGINGTTDYRFAPEYVSIFPKLRNWVSLIDFNKDGVMDIFTASGKYPGCIEVWRGRRDQNNRLTFRLLTFSYGLPEILQFPIANSYTQIYVSPIDLPAIVDVDGDGDTDIISFEADGSFASFYRNVSVEEKLGLDSLKYVRHDICWGKFAENQFNESITLSANAFSCAAGVTQANTGLRHSGSTTSVFDNDGDGDMDVIIGDIGSQKMIRLFNGGSLANAHMTRLEANFPAEDIPINLEYFLAAFYIDVDNDGIRELIITPNEVNSAESENHIWLYENTGTDSAPVFKFLKNNFLIDEMVYFNSASHPVFADVNADGLYDIIVGTGGIQLKNGVRKNRMVLMLNVGSNQSPAFKIIDEDYLQFSKYGDQTGRFAPAIGDLDHDGDDDLMIGDTRGQLYLLYNTAGKGNPMMFSNPIYPFGEIFVGQNAKPQIIDLDGDGLNDILVGEKNNELNFFKNIGTVSIPKFSSDTDVFPNTRQAGRIHVSNEFETQNGAPFFFSSENRQLLMVGTEDAGFLTYDNIEKNVYSGYNLLHTRTGNISQGRKVICSLADIDQDGLYEMVVGNERGGLVFYKTNFKAEKTSKIAHQDNELDIWIHPNPAANQVYVSSDHDVTQIELYHISGVKMAVMTNNASNDISALPDGIYFVRIFLNNRYLIKKLVIQKQ